MGTLFLVRAGYGLDVVGLVNAVMVFAIVAVEVPAGYAADRLGRRLSLAVGNAISAVVMGLYAFVGAVDAAGDDAAVGD